jgi:hypothetical protein
MNYDSKRLYNAGPWAFTINNYGCIIYGLSSKLVCFVQVIEKEAEKILAYYEICSFSANYESVMFYSTGPGD